MHRKNDTVSALSAAERFAPSIPTSGLTTVDGADATPAPIVSPEGRGEPVAYRWVGPDDCSDWYSWSQEMTEDNWNPPGDGWHKEYAYTHPAPTPTGGVGDAALLAEMCGVLGLLHDAAHAEVSPTYSERLDDAFTRAEIMASKYDSRVRAHPQVGYREPDGYAYRYRSNFGDGTTAIHFNSGGSVNGNGPIETIPYSFGAPKKCEDLVP